jgi:hypothetical protein
VDSSLEQGFAIRKGNKSKFLTQLFNEEDADFELPTLPPLDIPNVYLIDAMAFIN